MQHRAVHFSVFFKQTTVWGYGRQRRHESMKWNVTNDTQRQIVPMMTEFFLMLSGNERGLFWERLTKSFHTKSVVSVAENVDELRRPCGFTLWSVGMLKSSLTDTTLSVVTHNLTDVWSPSFEKNVKGLRNIYAESVPCWQGENGNMKSTWGPTLRVWFASVMACTEAFYNPKARQIHMVAIYICQGHGAINGCT